MEHHIQRNTLNIIYKQIHGTSYTKKIYGTSYTNKYMEHHIETYTYTEHHIQTNV